MFVREIYGPIRWPLIGALACMALVWIYAVAPLGRRVVEVHLSCKEPFQLRLTSDVGRGPDAKRAWTSMVPGSGEHYVWLDVPPGPLIGLRLDALQSTAPPEIRGVRLMTASGQGLINGLRFSTIQSGAWTWRAAHPISAGSTLSAAWPLAFLLVPVGFILFAVGLALRLDRQKLGLLRGRILMCVYGHPRVALAAVAALAVMASCHPVFFCGRSYVSPANGVFPMLHAESPTIPGQQRIPVEDAKGSDVGALFWAHMPYTQLTRRALFSDGEGPLWLRQNYCGVPLLGQGMAMIGDPLNALPMLADGAAWAWDAKFLLAKWAWCLGIGLCVFAVVRCPRISMLFCFSAGWIGFFGFRLNHPAFFSLCYAPWILLCWLHSVDARGNAAVGWAVALCAANVWELNSGTVKEAAALIFCLNFAGMLIVLMTKRVSTFCRMTLANIWFVLLSAPCWLPFLTALRQMQTPYDAPRAFQIQPSLVIGFFDDLFYRQLTPHESHFNPSVNFLVLAGVLMFFARFSFVARRPYAAALGGAALLPALVIFGGIPKTWLLAWPFVRNIVHLDNTFSCSLIVLVFPLAGLGLCEMLRCIRRGRTAEIAVPYSLSLSALLILFLGFCQTSHRVGFSVHPEDGGIAMSPVFVGYATLLCIALLALPWVFHWCRRWSFPVRIIILCVVLFPLHARHGMWLESVVDQWVVNPKSRMNLAIPSPAMERVKTMTQTPARVAGLGMTLAPGAQVQFGLEHLLGADPLSNPRFHELLALASLPQEWGWRYVIRPSDLPRITPLLDAMNVRFLFGEPASASQMLGNTHWHPVLDLDLYVCESPSVWPRAFYVSSLRPYDDVGQFYAMLQNAHGRPFGAYEKGDAPMEDSQRHATSEDFAAVPARDYRHTNGTTTFHVDAPGAGYVVLLEAYEEGNFLATVDGFAVPHVRVNHLFKAVRIPSAGSHAVLFTYRPKGLALGFLMQVIGVLGAIACMTWRMLARALKRPAAAHPTPNS